MKYSLRTILLAVAAVASALGVAKGFWNDAIANYQILLGIYILLVSAITIAAIPGNARFRGGLLGASAFGIVYFVTVIKGDSE